jgi:hypothetical protein
MSHPNRNEPPQRIANALERSHRLIGFGCAES